MISIGFKNKDSDLQNTKPFSIKIYAVSDYEKPVPLPYETFE